MMRPKYTLRTVFRHAGGARVLVEEPRACAIVYGRASR